jgi:hypothetical protein
MEVAWLVSFETAALRPRRCGLQIVQVAQAFAIVLEPLAQYGASAQAAVEPRARDVRIQELAQRAIDGAIGSSPMASVSRSSSEISGALHSATATASGAGVIVRRENDPLDRFLFRITLQQVRRVTAIRDTVALAPSPRCSNQWRARGSV